MRIAPELPAIITGEDSGVPAVRNFQGSAAAGATSTTSPTADIATAADATTSVSQAAGVSQQGSKQQATEQFNLSFRKDADGTVYYVVTDEQTGQVVREVPPEAVRNVGDGIEQYLKTQAALQAPKTDTMAQTQGQRAGTNVQHWN